LILHKLAENKNTPLRGAVSLNAQTDKPRQGVVVVMVSLVLMLNSMVAFAQQSRQYGEL
jgi:hypothetical protein